MKEDRMTYKETVATLEDRADEHHEVLHRLVTLINVLQDRVTRQGALWICKSLTTGSFDHECWQLAVKKGEAK
jgi:hypothetical protein